MPHDLFISSQHNLPRIGVTQIFILTRSFLYSYIGLKAETLQMEVKWW